MSRLTVTTIEKFIPQERLVSSSSFFYYITSFIDRHVNKKADYIKAGKNVIIIQMNVLYFINEDMKTLCDVIPTMMVEHLDVLRCRW